MSTTATFGAPGFAISATCGVRKFISRGYKFQIREVGLGHKLRGIAGSHVNLPDDHSKDAFAEIFQKMATAGNGQAKNRIKIELWA